jgi:hypothetical protein
MYVFLIGFYFFCFGGLHYSTDRNRHEMSRKKFRPVCIVLNTWSSILLFIFVLWYTLFLFSVEHKIVLYLFLYRCGHFNWSLIANQTISGSFLEMCSPEMFAHSLSKKESNGQHLGIMHKLADLLRWYSI